MDLFRDIIKSIEQTNVDLSSELEFEKTYNPYIVNRALSLQYDEVMYANEMNLLPGTSKKMQYDYLLHSIRKYKRPYQKWLKRETIEKMEVIKEYYGYSNDKAKQALELLTDEQIGILRAKLDKGGVSKKDK